MKLTRFAESLDDYDHVSVADIGGCDEGGLAETKRTASRLTCTAKCRGHTFQESNKYPTDAGQSGIKRD